MLSKYTFIGDIHSAADDLAILLQAESLKNSRLIFLGDYIDGRSTRMGTQQTDSIDPLAVLDLIMERVNEHHDIALLGNHDDFWLQTAYGDDFSYQNWRVNGGSHTWRKLGIHSSNFIVVADALRREPLHQYTHFLAQLPLTWSNDYMLAVHAGINWAYPLNQQIRDDLLWIRDDYYFGHARSWHSNQTNRIIITGHTPVQTIANNGYGYIKMQANDQDCPRYLIDAGSRSGAKNGGIFALTLSETGDVLAKDWVVKQHLFNGDKTKP